MNEYIFTLKHDRGTVRIRTVASCIASAIHIITEAENCPLRAIRKIVIKPLKTLSHA